MPNIKKQIKRAALNTRQGEINSAARREVRTAIKHVESNILKTHLEECVAKSFSDSEIAKEKIMEIKTLLDKMQS